jgi:hypothetical protein
MTFSLFERVVLTEDVPEEGLKSGDVGVVVEHYPAREGVPERFELEFFSASGKTIAVISVPKSKVRKAREGEVLSVRELART